MIAHYGDEAILIPRLDNCSEIASVGTSLLPRNDRFCRRINAAVHTAGLNLGRVIWSVTRSKVTSTASPT